MVLDIGSPFMESCQVEAVDRLAQNSPDLKYRGMPVYWRQDERMEQL